MAISKLQMWTVRLRRTEWYAQGHSAMRQQSQDSNPGLQILPGYSTVHSTVRTPLMQMQGYKSGITDGISEITKASNCLG